MFSKMSSVLVAAVTVFWVTAAYADVVTTFTASGTFQDGASLTGSLQIDTTTGSVLSASLAAGPPANVMVNTVGFVGTEPLGTDFEVQVVTPGSIVPQIILGFTGLTSFIGYTGGPLDSTSHPDPNYGASTLQFADLSSTELSSGQLTGPAVAVPEPMSMALLGVGAAGVYFLRRRRTGITA